MAREKLRKRKDIPDCYKWNMQDMFATDELWEEEAELSLKLADELAKYKGMLSASAKTLLEYFVKADKLTETFPVAVPLHTLVLEAAPALLPALYTPVVLTYL